ncbi:NADAR family protein [Actinoplanes sp. G11-F43]|uniref:NADAR family protein n=1 Tax=Actinoplanes sp. G11-F43 TaxID=3424130 RepID=UPI003D32E881
MDAGIRDVDGLKAAVKGGGKVKFLFFWGHQPGKDGEPGAGCLSQWFPSPFSVDGVEFATAEHYMMWRKAVLFGDDVMAGRILAAGHPHEAKKLGGRVAGFDQRVWDEHRIAIVVDGNLAKFGADPVLAGYLTGTGGRVLVEASPMDRIWGIGLTRDDERAGDPYRWRGLNLLGFALMEVRERLLRG